jgi:hypothetical protein
MDLACFCQEGVDFSKISLHFGWFCGTIPSEYGFAAAEQ